MEPYNLGEVVTRPVPQVQPALPPLYTPKGPITLGTICWGALALVELGFLGWVAFFVIGTPMVGCKSGDLHSLCEAGNKFAEYIWIAKIVAYWAVAHMALLGIYATAKCVGRR